MLPFLKPKRIATTLLESRNDKGAVPPSKDKPAKAAKLLNALEAKNAIELERAIFELWQSYEGQEAAEPNEKKEGV